MTDVKHGPIGDRIKARERRHYPVDLADALGLDAPAPVLVRVARSQEDEAAIVQGFEHVERAVKSLGGAAEAAAAARADTDLQSDARSRAAMALIFRDAADHDKPAFPSAEWLSENLSTDEIATLANIAAEVRRADARVPVPDDAGIEAIFGLLGRLADEAHAAPGIVMAPYPREVVTYVLVEAVMKLRAERARTELLEQRVAELQAELEAARSAPPSVAPPADEPSDGPPATR